MRRLKTIVLIIIRVYPKIGLASILVLYIYLWYVILLAIFASTFEVRNTEIEILQFSDEQHMEDIASAFMIELDTNESLYVSLFRVGSPQSMPSLIVVIEGIESAELFISRLHSNLNGLGTVTPVANSPQFGAFVSKSYRVIVYYEYSNKIDFGYTLTFFYDDYGGKNAELFLDFIGVRMVFRNVFNTLWKYTLSTPLPLWHRRQFLSLVGIQLALTALIVF